MLLYNYMTHSTNDLLVSVQYEIGKEVNSCHSLDFLDRLVVVFVSLGHHCFPFILVTRPVCELFN